MDHACDFQPTGSGVLHAVLLSSSKVFVAVPRPRPFSSMNTMTSDSVSAR